MRRPRRNPWVWSGLISLAALLGLGSRRFGRSLPGFVADYAGDTLWALVAFLVIGLLLPRASTWRVDSLAMSISAMVEVGQSCHALGSTRSGARPWALWSSATASSGATWRAMPSGSGSA